jgi:hypothetical protein
LRVPHRPLAFVSALTVSDYLLWNWSLTNGHDVLALIAGLTLLPLGTVWVWLITLTLARLLAHSARRGPSISARRPLAGTPGDPQPARAAVTASRALDETAAASTAASPASPSRKLAA